MWVIEWFLKRGQEIGWDRVIAGVHFPSDVYAGRVLGRALAQAMLKSSDFQGRLMQAKAEFESRGKAAQLEAIKSRVTTIAHRARTTHSISNSFACAARSPDCDLSAIRN